MKELNKFKIIHTDLKPENVAVVLEPEDFPNDPYYDKKFTHSRIQWLTYVEIAVIIIFYHEILRSDDMFEVFFDKKDHTTNIKGFLRHALKNRKLVKFFEPPLREKVLEKSSLCFFYNLC